MKKTVIFKTAFAAILIVLAFALVTCQPELIEGFEDGVEYTDVVYDYVGTPGNERVRSVTLYLDGKQVPKTQQQRAIEKRGLTLEGARMSHDYFEVVFMVGAATPAVARATWEIGQPAGISGVKRDTGTNYSGVTPVTTSGTASIIFVGKKTGKTLLGVGYLTHINNVSITHASAPVVDLATESVTFTVSPLATWLGLKDVAAVTTPSAIPAHMAAKTTRDEILVGSPTPAPFDTTYGTFETAYYMTPNTTPATGAAHYADATPVKTWGEMITPVPGGPAFPMYYLPSVKNRPTGLDAPFTVDASYRVGGLTSDTVGSTIPNLTTAVLVWGVRNPATPGQLDKDTTATTNLKGGLQFIKRTPAFMYEGRNYEVQTPFVDKITKVTETQLTPDTAFTELMSIRFTMEAGSGGIFAITFQLPVYALTIRAASNIGELLPEKWFIRPDYSQYQYLLDNGKDAGGAVLLGTDVSGGTDWIQINTQGIGFDNE